MAKYVSFIILVAIILVCGVVFFQVISGFILPLFLASLLAVIFRPLHAWIAGRIGNRPTLAAGLTTAIILLIVLGPLAGVLTVAIHEGNQVLRTDTLQTVKHLAVNKLRKFGLLKPFNEHLSAIESSLRELDHEFAEPPNSTTSVDPFGGTRRQLQRMRRSVAELWHDMRVVAETSANNSQTNGFPILVEHIRHGLHDNSNGVSLYPSLEQLDRIPLDELPKPLAPWDAYEAKISAASTRQPAAVPTNSGESVEDVVIDDSRPASDAVTATQPAVTSTEDSDLKPSAVDVDPWLIEKSYFSRMKEHDTLKHPFAECLSSLDIICRSMQRIDDATNQTTMNDLNWDVASNALKDAQSAYATFRVNLFGGPIRTQVIDFVNPGEQLDQLQRKAADYLRNWLPSITSQATAVAGSLLMGLAIMTVTLFYFLKDGAALVQAAMQLSPLDDRHERQLLDAFDSMSRAVVVATLLSAVAQGVLGGIGYALVGVESVFLLMMLTIILSMVPFVGAAAVWVPTAVWLALVDERYGAAIFLAVYGVLVISMADNFIKPWILQGQSNLHPLLGLLSVLGGVQALGPIGILVGPMVVSLLQVLLQLLQLEIQCIDEQLAATSAADHPLGLTTGNAGAPSVDQPAAAAKQSAPKQKRTWRRKK